MLKKINSECKQWEGVKLHGADERGDVIYLAEVIQQSEMP